MNQNILEIKNLSVKYGEHTVLDSINFTVTSHSFISIVGPNGAGKSTLIKVLLGLTEFSSGSVLIFGNKPGKVDSSLISYVPQIKTMDRNFPAIAIELVISGVQQRWPWALHGDARTKAENALQLVGAKQIANRAIADLSGGELQRVCIARSIAKYPKLIIMDEPAAGIDAVGESDLYKLLEDYQSKSDATILMITHDWHIANHHSDFVLVLNRKQISYGPPVESLKEENMRRAFGHIGHDHTLKSF
ncbi:MAG: metal ABC transporter ATP-binding protein [Ignavibacteriaceae bacterium]|nr:metal ABC transporter ATP-binding protein [Ignavibacteriaceae bacterium]